MSWIGRCSETSGKQAVFRVEDEWVHLQNRSEFFKKGYGITAWMDLWEAVFISRHRGSKGMGEWLISAEGDERNVLPGDPVAKTEGCQRKGLDFSQHVSCWSKEISSNNEILVGHPTGHKTREQAAFRVRVRKPRMWQPHGLHNTHLDKENVQKSLFLWKFGGWKNTHFRAGVAKWDTQGSAR